jgi:hypothetical protein
MARFGPTVLPREVDFGGILDRVQEGYYRGRGLREDRRHRRQDEQRERERQEDRSRYLRALRAQDLSQPGASTLSDYMDESLQVGADKPVELSERAQPRFRGREMATLRESPHSEARSREQAVAGSPLTEETLRRVGQASETDVPIEFRRPEPTPVRLPSGRRAMLRDRAPYLTESGVVMDPRRAREERSLSAALDLELQAPRPWQPTTKNEYLEVHPTPPPPAWSPTTKEEYKEVHPPTPRTPRLNPETALQTLQQLYGTWQLTNPDDPQQGGRYVFPFSDSQLRAMLQQMVPDQPIPEAPLPVARPIMARPPDAQPGGAPAPSTPAPAAAQPGKRIITQDQADYLRSVGKWDPSKYEVR